MSPTPDQDATTRSNSGSIDENARRTSSDLTGQENDKSAASAEKTISCVSCRRRKLKCDRAKPTCGTCVRLRHDCEYPERRRNLGSKRRNMKELEARLAQVETQLTSDTKSGSTSAKPSADANWDTLAMEMNIDFTDGGIGDKEFGTAPKEPKDQSTMPCGDFFSQEVISLGLEEPLPPDDLVEELTQIYFNIINPTVPIIHQYRFRASMDLPPAARPPVALRYVMWALAAGRSEKWQAYQEILYRRARKYAEVAEMKGVGEVFVSVYYAQAWSLIASFEAHMLYFSRAWVNVGKSVRLCQMLGLQRLDVEGSDVKRILSPPRDWIELEERRRTFWAAYYCDRWASAGTGWPMVIEEKDIMTNLPASDEAFQRGIKEDTVTLADALKADGASRLTSFGAVIFSAAVFGHNFEHLHRSGPEDHPENLSEGAFWKRHRTMDNTLSSTFMFIPDNLRLPGGIHDINVPFFHMNLFASIICLGQTAIKTAEEHKLDANFIKQCKARTLLAASEIANIMRLISHIEPIKMNPWMGFCLYTAASVFLRDLSTDRQDPQSLSNLEFLMQAMNALGKRHSVAKHFIAQLELNIEGSKLGIAPRSVFHGLGGQRVGQIWGSVVVRDEINRQGSNGNASQVLEACAQFTENLGRSSSNEVPSLEELTHTTFLKLPDRSREMSLNEITTSSDHMQQRVTSQPGNGVSSRPGTANDLPGNLAQTKWSYGSPGGGLTQPQQGGTSTNNSDLDIAVDTPSADSSSSNNCTTKDPYQLDQTPSTGFDAQQFEANAFDLPTDWNFDPSQMPGVQETDFSTMDFLNADIDMTTLKDPWVDIPQPGPD